MKKGQQGHTERGVEALEEVSRPAGLSPVLRSDEGRVVLLVEALYWGVRKMLVTLSSDRARMANAERFLAAFGKP